MKKLFVAFAMMIAVSVSFAQEGANMTPARRTGLTTTERTAADKALEVEKFITKIQATTEQAEKIRGFHASFTKDQAALESLKASDKKAYDAKVKSLGEGYVAKVNAILTPEQQKTFTALLAERNAKKN